MTNRKHQFEMTSIEVWRTTSALVLLCTLAAVLTTTAQAQTLIVIHSFTQQGDGAFPDAGLTIDVAGNLYGTTNEGGAANMGTVFKLKRSSSGWLLNPLYSFMGHEDGGNPAGRVAMGRDGTLYGTTMGGGAFSSGTVFHLTPPATAPRSALTSWNETTIYSFAGNDGQSPQGDLIFDQSGDIYGTTQSGGSAGNGVIYELSRSGSGWTSTVLYSPPIAADGQLPSGGVIFDTSGNLYGVLTNGGPTNHGAVYELSPSGSGWSEQILYGFAGANDGANPVGGLILDNAGVLYGTTVTSGSGGGGTAFDITSGPVLNTICSFANGFHHVNSGSQDKLAMDAAGNLYGTTASDGLYGYGTVFELTPSNGAWILTTLHNFTGGSDGGKPLSNVVMDASGNLYGTAAVGGLTNRCAGIGCGVIWEITP